MTENGGNVNLPSCVDFPATGIFSIAWPSAREAGSDLPLSSEEEPNTPGGSSGRGAPLRASARILVIAFGSAESVQ